MMKFITNSYIYFNFIIFMLLNKYSTYWNRFVAIVNKEIVNQIYLYLFVKNYCKTIKTIH